MKRQARGLVGGSEQLDRSIKATDHENLDLLPADFSHRNLDISFDRQKRRKQRLDIAFKPLRKEYDLIILDCPPTINILAENIFNGFRPSSRPPCSRPRFPSARYQLAVVSRTKWKTIPEQVSAFFSMVDARKKLHRQIMTTVRDQYSGILRSIIPYLSQIEQMGIYREPVPAFAPGSNAADCYQSLWTEMREEVLDE